MNVILCTTDYLIRLPGIYTIICNICIRSFITNLLRLPTRKSRKAKENNRKIVFLDIFLLKNPALSKGIFHSNPTAYVKNNKINLKTLMFNLIVNVRLLSKREDKKRSKYFSNYLALASFFNQEKLTFDRNQSVTTIYEKLNKAMKYTKNNSMFIGTYVRLLFDNILSHSPSRQKELALC